MADARTSISRHIDHDLRERASKVIPGGGPMILGYQHERVEQAAAQREHGDTQPGPSACMIELAWWPRPSLASWSGILLRLLPERL
jgi:hypothetical protein